MPVSEAAVLDGLRRVKGPDLDGNIVDLGMVSEIAVRDGRVTFAISVPPNRAEELEPLRQAAEKVVSELEGVSGVTAVLTAETKSGAGGTARPAAPTARGRAHEPASPVARSHAEPRGGAERRAAPVPGVKHLVAVASGKGGVGKSTTAVNLALGFKALGRNAGILDADIFGPSQPRLLGLKGRPEVVSGRTLKPMEAYGLQAMSMGFMVDENTPVVWRGPMVTQALNQMLREVAWRDLDILVIDMPPGTGDVQLTLAQQAPLSGAIIVSTPQDLALIDARKGLAMFEKVDVPVLGVIENMSTFICPKCGERSDIFGHGGAEAEAAKLGVPFLGAVPLHIDIRETSDTGRPMTATAPESAHARIYREIAARAASELDRAQAARSEPPRLEINDAKDSLAAVFAGGARHELTAELLRVMSPSAEVQGHSPEQRVTVAGKRMVKIRELRPVGNYAVRIVFDDGHDTGLYTWGYLEQLGREKAVRWKSYLAELEKKGLSRG